MTWYMFDKKKNISIFDFTTQVVDILDVRFQVCLEIAYVCCCYKLSQFQNTTQPRPYDYSYHILKYLFIRIHL